MPAQKVIHEHNINLNFTGLSDIFGNEKKLDKILKLQHELLNLAYKAFAQKTDLTLFFNNLNQKTMALELDVQQFLAGVLGLVDHTTQNVVPATFANESFTSSDVAIFTAVQDGDDTVDVTGIAEGTADLTVSADATYTDANTGQEVTVNKTVVIPVTVKQSINPEETDLVVNFGQAGKVKTAKA